ncbi:MAG TPA: 3-hydroxyacyl-CoA dehydrogenase family protein [Terriglobales bacterium]|nr:3-hydroxyacyl-CoA dehydrogenase family protein [Terriglobales bacterium]
MAEVQTIAVIGAGKLGRGIAQVAALGGYHTILEDLLPNALRRAESELRTQLDEAVKMRRLSADAARTALSRLEFAGSVEDAARAADLVIESVPEELESKIEIFTLLDKICRPGTILASHTTTLSVSEIARVTYRTRNCLGMRFSTPVDPSGRLEIIRSAETDDQTLAAAVEVGRRMGQKVSVISDSATWQK